MRYTMDGAGTPSTPITYDPWGTVTSGSVPTFGFTGELQQGGLVDLRARWYSTSEGRFGSRDPFAGYDEQPISLHPYHYAGIDPVNRTDPSGRCYGALEFMRTASSWEADRCRDLDKAILLYSNPQTSGWDKALAYSYAASWYVGHGILIAEIIFSATPGAAAATSGAVGDAITATWLTAGNTLGGVFTAGSAWLAQHSEAAVADECPLAAAAEIEVADAEAISSVAGVVSKYTPSDAEALGNFADEAPAIQAARGMKSFGSTWKAWGQAAESIDGMADDLFVYRVDGRITGAMKIANGETALKVVHLEGFGGGAGTKLLQTAIHESIARGYGGQLLLDASQQAVEFYENLGFVLIGGPGYNEYFLNAESARQLLQK